MSPFPVCPATLLTVCLHIGRCIVGCNATYQLLSNIRMRFSRSLLTVHDSLACAFNTFTSIVQICTNWWRPRVNIDNNTTSYHLLLPTPYISCRLLLSTPCIQQLSRPPVRCLSAAKTFTLKEARNVKSDESN